LRVDAFAAFSAAASQPASSASTKARALDLRTCRLAERKLNGWDGFTKQNPDELASCGPEDAK
jgi:hypothetical protein